MAASANSASAVADKKKSSNPHAIRETVESVIVAFILAFLFRAFVAEAFVIPTGSMAPTLMGAHKDIVCEHCGAQYQSSASSEFNPETGTLTDAVAVASTCAMCRGGNHFDLAGNGNHATFPGDRILVSKFDYLFSDPDRWDVLVFKFPTDARMNYIKRLVGLPGEFLHIEGGDVYVRKQASQPWQLARKPPDKAMAMMQVVSDTEHQARELVAKGWPSLWQPQADAGGQSPHAWKAHQAADSWSAQLAADASADETHWLRYYHKYFDDAAWDEVASGAPLPDIHPYQTSLITDFLAYNTTKFGDRSDVYDSSGRLDPRITSEDRAIDVIPDYTVHFDQLTGRAQDGLHWVGDLAAEFDVDVASSAGTLSFDLVEFGIHYRCQVDIASGKATLHVVDNGQPLNAFASSEEKEIAVPSAATSLRGPGRHRVRFANIDDQLMVWIDGSLVKFDRSTEYDSHKFRTAEARRPYWTASDPLDAAPIAIGGQGADLTVHRAQVWRDIYYIAIQFNNYSDYDERDLQDVIDSIDDPAERIALQRNTHGSLELLSWIYRTPEQWESTKLFAKRRSMEFSLGEGEFFPMGDNSAASSDARAWSGHHYVERRFLIGKALLVFWPHRWNSPVPFPNFSRMGRIR